MVSDDTGWELWFGDDLIGATPHRPLQNASSRPQLPMRLILHDDSRGAQLPVVYA